MFLHVSLFWNVCIYMSILKCVFVCVSICFWFEMCVNVFVLFIYLVGFNINAVQTIDNGPIEVNLITIVIQVTQLTPTKKRKYEWQSIEHDLHKTFFWPKILKENEMGGDVKNTYRGLNSQAPWSHFGVHMFFFKVFFF
jgi:hypothetical protein